MPRHSYAHVLRQAQRVIECQAQAKTAPLVVWAGIGETEEAFAVRCRGLHHQGRLIAAVPFGFKLPSGVQGVEFAPKMYALLYPTYSRYRVAAGGRGSSKSHAFATALVLRMLSESMRVLCAREFQRSLRESVHHLLSSKIEKLGLASYFDISERAITCVLTRSEIIFAGLFQNASQLTSLEEIRICWLEQAEVASARSIEILIPTIRDNGSEVWMSANPTDPDAPVQVDFIDSDRDDVRRTHVIFSDNPWFTDVLEKERLYMQRTDPDAYAHVYLGETIRHSDAQVFKGKYVIEEFTPQGMSAQHKRLLNMLAAAGKDDAIRHVEAELWNGPYLGADFGFAADPSTLIRAWTYGKTLYVEHEAWGLGVDTKRLPELYKAVPDAVNHVIRADNSRPETISDVKQNGYPRMEAVKKWAGSVEDGVSFLRSFEKIVIHPRCTHTADEFRHYMYKVDRLTGDIKRELVDKHNHCIDALRYALQPIIKARRNARFEPLFI